MNCPPFDSFPVLSSETVLLRELTYADADALLEIFTYNGKFAKNVSDVIEMLDRIDDNYRSGDSINWGIVDKASGEIAGTCGYYRGFEDETGEIGFILRPAWRGKGWMSEALKLAVAYGKEELQLKRVIAITLKSNTAARKLLERNSFRYVEELFDDYLEFEFIR